MRLHRSDNRLPIRSKSPEERVRPMGTTIRARSLSPVQRNKCEVNSYRYDSHNRLHVNFPKTGPVHVFNRAMKFHTSTIETHANDLTEILLYDVNKENKTAVSITCDNGPDWNFKSPLTHLYMGRLWRDIGLDYLVLVSFAPGHSAENMIEHAWAPLCKYLAGVTLPASLPGEDKPPCKQRGITIKERERKEAEVLDLAIEKLNMFWDKKFDGHPINSKKVACLEEAKSKKYNDYGTVKKFFDSGVKKQSEHEEFKQIGKEYKFLMQHCRKTTNCLEFIKCRSAACVHCQHHPVQARSLMNLLNKHGGNMFSPTPSSSVPDSYNTFLELAFSPLCNKICYLDEECPSVNEKEGEDVKCQQGCNYIFSSAADAKRHKTLIHQTGKKRSNAVKKLEGRKKLKVTNVK